MPEGACDALYSRMVIHMIPEAVFLKAYIPQWAKSVRINGTMFMTDHNPTDGKPLTGPRRPMDASFFNYMMVVPQWTEVEQITSRGFQLIDGPFDHDYFDGGYGAVYTPAPEAYTPAPSR